MGGSPGRTVGLTLHVQLHLGLARTHVEAIIASCLAAVGPAHVAVHTLQPQLPIRGLFQGQPRGQQRSLLVHAGPEHRRPRLAPHLALQLSGRTLTHGHHSPALGHTDGGWHCRGVEGWVGAGLERPPPHPRGLRSGASVSILLVRASLPFPSQAFHRFFSLSDQMSRPQILSTS